MPGVARDALDVDAQAGSVLDDLILEALHLAHRDVPPRAQLDERPYRRPQSPPLKR